jgi:hypothetical protein
MIQKFLKTNNQQLETQSNRHTNQTFRYFQTFFQSAFSKLDSQRTAENKNVISEAREI